ncbi:MAG: zinc-binding dehydrogenase [Desulfobacteraceae bacterium]|nr:zinc-binding dehydrogenase [Desulfobacteraceae bacterium]
MRAAILENNQLKITEIAKPSPGRDQALVRLTAAGVCHSDIHLVKGDWPRLALRGPTAMGHEGIGVVEALGPGAEQFLQMGDRVIMGLGGLGGGFWCGACEFCLSGRPRLCHAAKPLLGTYAEYIAAWAKALVPLPEQVADREVSLACGGLTAYSAIKKLIHYGVSPGRPVALIGAAGGLGHYAVQIAKAFGFMVVGVDLGPDKAAFVKQLGADYALDVKEALECVHQALGGVDGCIVFTPKVTGFELGLRLLKRGGVFIGVGMPPATDPPMTLHPLDLAQKELLITSSAVGNVEEMRELIQLAARGKVSTHASLQASLSELPAILEALDQGKYTGRAIINDLSR